MLGIDENASDAATKGIDAVKELLNMIVGNFLTASFGEDAIFDLGLPRILAPETLSSACRRSEAIWFRAENNPVLFVADIDD